MLERPKKMNTFSPELKIQIVNAQALIDETRREMKEKSLDIDLTGKLQLRDDCAYLERLLRQFAKGKTNPKMEENLKNGMIRLQTTSYNLLRRPFGEE
ncbi:MAG: hypothetical protein ACLU9Q_08540 [Marvinbryantia sp.]|mgnify:CR=1 FL=1|uniref:hypothetical protein n=1 Tax=Marvinbryantia sp. TaxID=2496532 RepID=UPI00266FECD4|nr:hypothetical protein [uncultured Marvinbryantia sp.]